MKKFFNTIGLRLQIFVTVALACLICAGISLGVSIYYNNIEFRQGLVDKSRLLHGRLDVAAKYVATQGGLAPMIERMTQKYKSPAELTNDDKNVILQQVPIYAAMKVGAEGASDEHYKFRVFSDEPRNKENMATAEELKIFKQFEADEKLKELVVETDKLVTVYRPVRLESAHGCMTCHGDPQKSPWKNGQDILGFKMENWPERKLHGVFAVVNNLEEVVAAQAAAGHANPVTHLSLYIVLGSILAIILAAFMVKGTLATIAAAIKSLDQGSAEVSTASSQIADSAQGLSESSSTQAASLEETVATVEELAAMVKTNSDHAKEASRLAETSFQTAGKGEQEILSLVSAIEDIAGDSKKIKDITNVIDDIAFQTNLLALNAAVEAARAGEQGKGFAVVAEAVRNLAQRSALATKDIADLIQSSVDKIDRGATLAHRGGEVLNEIVTSVQRVSELNREISLASEEQTKGISQISQTLAGLDEITQRNAAAAEESAAASEQMSAQSQNMKENIASLTLVVSGASALDKKFKRVA